MEFSSLNRTAIVVSYKQPMVDWMNDVFSEDPVDTKEEDFDNTIYLLPQFDDLTGVENYLRKHYEDIVGLELFDWVTDDSMWPKDWTYEKFKEWFDVKIHTTIVDVCKKEIIREKL